jgi:hypothetical protein
MTTPARALHIVGPEDAAPALSRAFAAFDDLAPGLAGLASVQVARRGDRLRVSTAEPMLRIVADGVLCLTHGDAGVCVAMVAGGAPLGVVARSGVWLTDGALAELPLARLAASCGPEVALAVCGRAAAQSQLAVEAELLCLVQHPASRRFGRWFRTLLRETPEILLTQLELAGLSGLQRTSACAAMATLQETGGLKVIRGRIRLQDAVALEQESCRCGEVVPQAADKTDADAATADPFGPDKTCRRVG